MEPGRQNPSSSPTLLRLLLEYSMQQTAEESEVGEGNRMQLARGTVPGQGDEGGACVTPAPMEEEGKGM